MDKKGKDTGKGKFEVDASRAFDFPKRKIIIDLYNYNFDGNLLKTEHKECLDTEVIPVLKEKKWFTRTKGMASHKGNDAYNQQLSLERVLRVRDYMISKGVTTLMPAEAVGESEANPNLDDDERDRAVRLTIEPELKPQPIIVKKKPVPPPPIFVPPLIPPPIGGTPPDTPFTDPSSQNFQIRMVKAANAGVAKGVSGDLITFEIRDVDNNIHAFYNYQGVAVGIGTPLSYTEEGPFNDFKTSAPMQVTQFEGLANFDTMGAGPFTINELNLPLPPPGVKPISIKMKTGTTFGGGFSTGVGGMVRTSSARPYKGP
jgi:hypothetical protein